MAIDLSKLVNPSVEGVMTIDTINEKTLNNGVVIDSVKMKDGEVYNSSNVQLSNVQDIQNTAADKASYYFGTALSDRVSVAQPFTGNQTHTVMCCFRNNSLNTVSIWPFSFGAFASNQGGYITVNNSNVLTVGILGATVTSTIADKQYKTASYSYDGSKVVGYLNGVKIGETNYSSANLGGSGVRIGNIINDDNNSKDSSVSRLLIFNYALDENKIKKYSAGAKLDFEDVGGSMTLINNSVWNNAFGWFDGGFSSSSPTTFTGTKNGAGISGASFLTTLKLGKKYRLTVTTNFTGTITSAIFNGGDGVGTLFSSNCVSGVPFSIDFEMIIAEIHDRMSLASTVGSGTFTYSNISIIQLGAVLDLEPENITDGTWFDASPNGLHGTVTGAIANKFIPSYSSRNYVINGNIDFSQRGNYTSSSASTDGTYYIDRWKTQHGLTANKQVITSSLPVGSEKSFRLTATATATSYMGVQTSLEALNNLVGKYITFSAYVKSNHTKARLRMKWGTSDSTWLESKAHTGSGAWELLTLTRFVPTNYTVNANLNLQILIVENNAGVSITSGDYAEIAQAMLNEGPVAVPFERAGGTIAGELALCKRYCLKLYDSTDSSDIKIRMAQYSTNTMYFHYSLQQTMRISPTLYSYGTEGTDWQFQFLNTGGTTGYSLSLGATTKNVASFVVTKTSHGQTDGVLAFFNTGKVILDAEI